MWKSFRSSEQVRDVQRVYLHSAYGAGLKIRSNENTLNQLHTNRLLISWSKGKAKKKMQFYEHFDYRDHFVRTEFSTLENRIGFESHGLLACGEISEQHGLSPPNPSPRATNDNIHFLSTHTRVRWLVWEEATHSSWITNPREKLFIDNAGMVSQWRGGAVVGQIDGLVLKMHSIKERSGCGWSMLRDDTRPILMRLPGKTNGENPTALLRKELCSPSRLTTSFV